VKLRKTFHFSWIPRLTTLKAGSSLCTCPPTPMTSTQLRNVSHTSRRTSHATARRTVPVFVWSFGQDHGTGVERRVYSFGLLVKFQSKWGILIQGPMVSKDCKVRKPSKAWISVIALDYANKALVRSTRFISPFTCSIIYVALPRLISAT
jgi:hypothetical protein